ncbi:hypothetical protein LTR78_008656 [Recurvomyces mirabilis]|uniref:Flavin reductase like domain-containing protein n=1 Tax=Recurvomyces mirabilis TaxID=574656 RepID=A0AAE0TPM2_9PEZI|nr:hypothetical protein LTR78_008656 [Recurvomyces mirabilis]KAK5159259.1 hypothetical protein LTS14_002401 [Recurvomyces mirabilis]
MARPSAEARRFYTAFYQWTVLLARPKPATAGRSCRHATTNTTRRAIHSTTRRREEQSVKWSGPRIHKFPKWTSIRRVEGEHASLDFLRPSADPLPKTAGTQSGQYHGKPYRLGGPQSPPPPQPQARQSGRPHHASQLSPDQNPSRTTTTSSSLLTSPIQTHDAKPPNTVQLWDVAIRYRSPTNNLIIEICIPLDRANALEEVYGSGLERLGRETGAKIGMGAATRLRTSRKGVRGSRVTGLVVSGGLEGCAGVLEVVEGVRRQAGYTTDMVEDRAGDGVSEGMRVRAAAGIEPRTGVQDNEQQGDVGRGRSGGSGSGSGGGGGGYGGEEMAASGRVGKEMGRREGEDRRARDAAAVAEPADLFEAFSTAVPSPHLDQALGTRTPAPTLRQLPNIHKPSPSPPQSSRTPTPASPPDLRPYKLLARPQKAGKVTYDLCLPQDRLRILHATYRPQLEGLSTWKHAGMKLQVRGPFQPHREDGSEEPLYCVAISGPTRAAASVRTIIRSLKDEARFLKLTRLVENRRGLGDDGKAVVLSSLEVRTVEVLPTAKLEVSVPILRARTAGGEGGVVEVVVEAWKVGGETEEGVVAGLKDRLQFSVEIRFSEPWELKDGRVVRALVLEGGWMGMEAVLRRLRRRRRTAKGLTEERMEVAQVEGGSGADEEADGVGVSTVEEGYWETAASVAPPYSMDHDGVEAWDSSSIPSEMLSGESTSSPTSAILPRDTASSSPAAMSSKKTASSPPNLSGVPRTKEPSKFTVEHGKVPVKAPSKHDWVVVAESAESITLDITIWRDRLDLLYAMRGPKLEGLMTGKFEGVQISVLDNPTPGSVTTGASHDVGAEQARAVVRIAGPPLTARKARDAVWLVQGERGFAYQKALLETEAVAGEEDREVARSATVLKWKRSVRSREAHPVSTMPLLGYAVRARWEDELGGTLEMVVAERRVPGSGDVEVELLRGLEKAVKIDASQMWEKDGEAVRSVIVEGSWEGIARVLSKARGWGGKGWEAVTAGQSTAVAEELEHAETTTTTLLDDTAKEIEVPATEHEHLDVVPDPRDPRHPAPKWSEHRALGTERDGAATSAVVRGSRSFSTVNRARSYPTQASAPQHDDSLSTAALSPTNPAKPVSHDEHEHNNIEIVVLPLYVRPHLIGKNGETRARIISQSGIKDLRIASSPRGLEHTQVYITGDDPRARRKAEALVQEVYQWAVRMDPHLTYLWFWRSKVSLGHDVSASAFEQPKARFVAVLRLADQDRKRRARIKRFVLGGAERYRLHRTAVRSFTEIKSFWGRHGGFWVSGYEMRDVERAVLLLRMQIRQMPDADEREREGGEVTETFVERAVADGKGEFVKVEGSEWGSEISGEQESGSGSVRDGEGRAVQSGAGSAGAGQNAGEQEVPSEEFGDSLYDSQVVLVPHAGLQMQKDVDDFLLRDERAALELISQQTNCQIYKRQRPSAGVWVMRGRKDDLERAKILLQKRLDVAREILGIAKLKLPRLLLELSSRIVDDDERTQRHNVELGNDVRAVSRPLTQSVVLITTRMPGSTPGDTSGQEFADCRGVTVSSFTTVTIQPVPVVSFNLKLPSRTWDAMERSGRLCIHAMAATPEAAAITHVFTQKHDLPSHPFGELIHNGINVVVPSDDDTSPPRIKTKTGAVLARVECRILMEKSVFVGDHVVVFAEVYGVALPGVARDASRAEMLERLEEATGLAYAKRGFRGIGEVIEVSPQWEKPAAHQVEMVDGVEGPAKVDTPATTPASVTYGAHAADPGTSAHDVEADSRTGNKRRLAAIANEEDDYDFGFLRDRDAGKDLEDSVSEILEVGSKSHRPHRTSR